MNIVCHKRFPCVLYGIHDKDLSYRLKIVISGQEILSVYDYNHCYV